MADISVRGYVNRPKTDKAGEKQVLRFSVSEAYKDKKTGNKTYGFYNCTIWDPKIELKDGQYVTMTGRLKQRQYEKDGVKRISMDVNVDTILVSPPLEPKAPQLQSDDNWKF